MRCSCHSTNTDGKEGGWMMSGCPGCQAVRVRTVRAACPWPAAAAGLAADRLPEDPVWPPGRCRSQLQAGCGPPLIVYHH
ncbi:uncharacterized protein LOC144579581 isoform X2 [Callithrix jacchus]